MAKLLWSFVDGSEVLAIDDWPAAAKFFPVNVIESVLDNCVGD